MPKQATVGLVGSRSIDYGLQSSNKTTVTDFTFPSPSRTPNEISIPYQGATDYQGPKAGDCYASGVEDTHLYARAAHTTKPAPTRAMRKPCTA